MTTNPRTTEELMPCPFCGCKDIEIDEQTHSKESPYCTQCGVLVSTIEEWNTRVPATAESAEPVAEVREVAAALLLHADLLEPRNIGTNTCSVLRTQAQRLERIACTRPSPAQPAEPEKAAKRELMQRKLRSSFGLESGSQPADSGLTVWYGAMPETNGKSNFTAILMRKGGDICDGITLDRSEYPDRVRYEADRARHLIGELEERPDILAYDADKHSGYSESRPSAVKAGQAIPDGMVAVPRDAHKDALNWLKADRVLLNTQQKIARTPAEISTVKADMVMLDSIIAALATTEPGTDGRSGEGL